MFFQSFNNDTLFRRLAVLSVLSTILIVLRFRTWQSERLSRNTRAVDLAHVSIEEHFVLQDEDIMSDRAVNRHLEKKRGQHEEQDVLRGTKLQGRRPLEDKVFKMDPDSQGLATITASTRYLTYTPHSGFHNQRIALINALQLAAQLNRTLLVPPVVLGKPTHWREADVLEDWHRQRSKARTVRCIRLTKTNQARSSCRKRSQYTSLRWDRLFDLRELKRRVAIQYRDDYEPGYLERHFGLVEDDIFKIKDTTLYDYRISNASGSGLGKYQRTITLDDLNARSERLIQFGSLFGTGRVATSTTPASRDLRDFIESQFVLSAKDVLGGLFDVADRIIGQLGGPGRFLSVHARVGDSMFERFSEQVMARIWADLQEHVPKQQEAVTVMSPQTCLDIIQKNELGNVQTLFMATDASQPRTLPLFKPIFETFPCVITLDDVFDYAESPLTALVNPEDGVAYGEFLIPFLDSLVASRARDFTGSMWSTFSSYIRFQHEEYKRGRTTIGPVQ